MSERSDKLVKLRDWWDLETGEPHAAAFECDEVLYLRSCRMKHVDDAVRQCRRCPDILGCVPGWGNVTSSVMIVGQSLHKAGLKSGVPFIGGSGVYPLSSLWLRKLLRRDVYWTNVVHGHPPHNRASTDSEKENCLEWLREEAKILHPEVVVLLGNDAKEADVDWGGAKKITLRHPASMMKGAAPEARIDWIVKLSDEIDKVLQ